MKTIFEKSKNGRVNSQFIPKCSDQTDIDSRYLRSDNLQIPEVSELDVVRHYTTLSQKNYCIDTNFYPLGSCTMKYNPKVCMDLPLMSAFQRHHPLMPAENCQGVLEALYELQTSLQEITGMASSSLTPMAGAQGEWAGVRMIQAYHEKRGDANRTEMLVSDAAHGTNPASAAMCGYEVKEVPTNPEGDIDLAALKEIVGPKTAGIMLTNPSTLGCFERNIQEVASIMHDAGALLYYDGANLNAILGKVRPGDMGFDVLHLNLHKTFATPHGGGGPGSGPILASRRLQEFLPGPFVEKSENMYCWKEAPLSIGRLSCFMGNTAVLLRAYAYILLVGKKGLSRIGEYATLNANYLMKNLKDIGYTIAYPQRRASHEFLVTLSKEAKEYGVTALDVAKKLLDFGFYAPTVYFPLLVPECLLIEPTETESKETLDSFLDAMQKIYRLMQDDPESLKKAPLSLSWSRFDEVRAAREPELTEK